MDKPRRFPIVGLGASAGGIEALERFFRPFPAEPGLAFVVITHLSPTHPSHMREILARFTPMTVRTADDGLELKPNEIVVITEDTILDIEGEDRTTSIEVGIFHAVEKAFLVGAVVAFAREMKIELRHRWWSLLELVRFVCIYRHGLYRRSKPGR